ncbi:hypothetical protein MTR_1g051540 [Medicago truncatula]|uniref:Uncharacterized protein n=1 Tax=Medicago truncatula TaxID=3880 RepID=G7ZVW2_MEDTR|nr:hypothetical protein MTR_1g051540 [Medicago truncatula]
MTVRLSEPEARCKRTATSGKRGVTKIPFTMFEMDVLRLLNVAPTQIHLNSWAFIRGFEILCDALDMIPSPGVFFHFTERKGWIKVPGYLLVVQASKDSTVSVASVAGEVRFPLGWTANPLAVSGYHYQKMTPYEQGVVGFLDRMKYLEALKEKHASGEHIASDPAGVILRKGAKKRELVANAESAGGDAEITHERVIEGEITEGEVNVLEQNVFHNEP